MVCAFALVLPRVFAPLVWPRAAVALEFVFAATAESAVDVAVRVPAFALHQPVVLPIAGARVPARAGSAAAPDLVERAAVVAAAKVRVRGQNWRGSGKLAWVVLGVPWDGSPWAREGLSARYGGGDSLWAARGSLSAFPDSWHSSPAPREEPSLSPRFERWV